MGVDQLIIQTLGVVIAATSVVLYIINLFIQNRKEAKNNKVTLTNQLLQKYLSEEGSQTWAELMNIKWENFNDFVKRYDSSVNPEHFGKRWSMFSSYDSLGYLWRKGLIDEEIVFKNGYMAIQLWARYKPLIVEYRKIAYGENHFADFEYLANELWKKFKLVEPGYTRDRTNFSDDSFEKAYESVKV